MRVSASSGSAPRLEQLGDPVSTTGPVVISTVADPVPNVLLVSPTGTSPTAEPQTTVVALPTSKTPAATTTSAPALIPVATTTPPAVATPSNPTPKPTVPTTLAATTTVPPTTVSITTVAPTTTVAPVTTTTPTTPPTTVAAGPTTAVDDQASVAHNRTVSIPVLQNDDFGGSAANLSTLAVGVAPANGIVSVSGRNIVFDPQHGYRGPDSFTYSICSLAGSCSHTTVHVTITDH